MTAPTSEKSAIGILSVSKPIYVLVNFGSDREHSVVGVETDPLYGKHGTVA
jgi:hypothetical protein